MNTSLIKSLLEDDIDLEEYNIYILDWEFPPRNDFTTFYKQLWVVKKEDKNSFIDEVMKCKLNIALVSSTIVKELVKDFLLQSLLPDYLQKYMDIQKDFTYLPPQHYIPNKLFIAPTLDKF